MRDKDPLESSGFSIVIYFKFVEKSIKLAAVLTCALSLPLMLIYNEYS